MDPEDTARNQCKVQLEVLYHIQAIPNQFHNLLPILYHFINLPWVWKVAIQKGCHSHHPYHRNLRQRNYWKCPIQMCFGLEELDLKVVMTGLEMKVGTCFELEELDLKVVMMGLEMRVGTVHWTGGKVVGMGVL